MEKAHKILLTVLLAWLAPFAASAATLYVSPASGSYGLEGTFSVNVYASSLDQAMNATSATIAFPPDKLEVTTLSKEGSIFSLWIQEPTISNADGVINFKGVVLNPGYMGAAGKILTVTFKAKAISTAAVNFSSARVLANDGKGTDILKGTIGATYGITAVAAVPAPSAGTPEAPRVSSSTHPNPDGWYAATDAKFSWPVPNGSTAARLLIDKTPDASPIIEYSPPISSWEMSDLANGVWYFNAQLGNTSGWGAITSFRLRIDTEKPSRFELTEVPRPDLTEPKATFVLDAFDSLSGIDHYDVSVDGGVPESWKDDGSHRYVTKVLAPGKHALAAAAIDQAGNSLSANAEFVIEALEPPSISVWTSRGGASPIIVQGSTFPDSQVVVWIKHGGEELSSAETRSGADGKFTFTTDGGLPAGAYQAWAKVTDPRGAKSGPSEKVGVTVVPEAGIAVALASPWAASLAAVLLAALIALGVAVLFARRKATDLKRRVQKKAQKAILALRPAFDTLQKDIRRRIGALEKKKGRRMLTEKEERLLEQLKINLDAAKSAIRKKIEDIKRKMK
ncbi:MAG: hypothetical protein PHT12_02200 [Patescibacteria group bacterium]|nr:hypothetical protein [Patescibacteria group bacterium]